MPEWVWHHDRVRQDREAVPPSGRPARAWALGALFLPIVLPAAVVYARRAGREAALSPGKFSWPQRLIDRPLIFSVVVWLGFFALMFGLTMVLSVFFEVPPI